MSVAFREVRMEKWIGGAIALVGFALASFGVYSVAATGNEGSRIFWGIVVMIVGLFIAHEKKT